MDSKRCKIVLVDDNLATLTQGKSLLQDMYSVSTVSSPLTFFENLEYAIPDLILLDVDMPEMNGFEVMEKLKADDRYKNIPVIFLTSISDEESENKGFSLGAVDYVTKPFSGPLLKNRISNQLLYNRVNNAIQEHSKHLDIMVRENITLMERVERRNRYMKTLNDISSVLIVSDLHNYEQRVRHSMGLLAETFNVNRVYIWENHTSEGKLFSTQLYEWSESAEPQQGNEYTVDVPIDELHEDWLEILSNGGCVNSLVRDLPPATQAILIPQNIVSILIVPLFLNELLWGFIGFDDCINERVFTKNEETILRSAGRMYANAIELARMRELNEFQLTKLNLAVKATKICLWDMTVSKNDPVHPERIIIFSDEFRSMLGYSDETDFPNLLGSWIDRLHPDDKDYAIDAFEKHLLDKTGNTPFDVEYRLLKKGGEYSYYRASGETIRDKNGDATRVAGSLMDITDIKNTLLDLEKQRIEANAANKAKSEFLAKMSHEIRTPMNAIIGMTELALREKTQGAMREHVLTVKQAGANLLAIINDILDFSKIEIGRLEIIPEYYSLSSLINDVVSIIRMRLIDSSVSFLVNIDNNIPSTLFGDETRIRQMLLNLLINAVKFTEKGYVSFTVCGEFIDDDSINLVIEVTDTGIGIKQDYIDELFDEFAQFDPIKNRNVEGVGLGLAITNSMLKAMGGHISVKSEYGQGSTFTMTLTQKYCNREPLATVKHPDNKGVLLYEHRELYADSVANTVSNLGVNCTVVANDSELYITLKAREHSFLFISFSLYRYNEEILSKFGKHIKIVVLAGFGEVITDTNLNTLAIPVYSVTVAGVLNGITGKFSYSNCYDSTVSFTAPEARVLVVDDINTNLKVAQGLLMPYDVKVDLCKSGIESIGLLQSKDYDLVFMDHKMPGMDGVEAVMHIRKMGEEDSYFKNVPIIALTANAISGAGEVFLESGFDDCLFKPINTIRLNSILEKWLPKSKQERQVAAHSSETEASDNVIDIKGLDVSKGISMSGGVFERYLDTLSVFHDDVLERIVEINKSLESGDLPLYVTHVHGLKGAAALIGGDELSEIARTLEMAGRRSDLDYINAHNAGFIDSLNSLLSDIMGTIKKAQAKTFIDLKACKSGITELISAIDHLDAGAMHNVIDDLIKSTQGTDANALIKKIADYILISEYDEATALLEALLEEIG